MVDKAEEKEIWKTYPEFPFIEASNLGRVRIKDRVTTRSNGRKYHIKGHVLKQQTNKNGYMYVQFSMNGKHFSRLVHRVIAITFLPNPNNLPEVNHKDNNRTNNSVDNLEWCTRQYNQDYKKSFGASPSQVQGRPVIAINQETLEIFWFESQHEAARQLDIYNSNINKVVKSELNKTGNCWFCYADKNAVEKVRSKFGDEIAKKAEELIRQNQN